MRNGKIIFVLIIVALFSSTMLAQTGGFPVDIPGTDVNFFLYRYEGDVPTDKINAIWENLSLVFEAWVNDGQRSGSLSGQDVRVVEISSDDVSIYIKDQFIVAVDEKHAIINKATPVQLAEKWASNLALGVDEFVARNKLK